MSGFFGGMISGAVVVVVLGVVLSLNTPLGSKPDMQTVAPQASTIQPPLADSEVTGAGPDSDLVELAPRALDAPDDDADATGALAEIQAEPDGRPQIGQGVAAFEKPGIGQNGAAVVSTEAPAAPPAPAPVPASPDQAVQPVDVDSEPPAAPDPSNQVTAQGVEPGIDQGSQPNPKTASTETGALPNAPEAEAPSITSQSPIAVEGNEDTAPRKRARIAALPQIGAEQPAPLTRGVGKRVVPLTERDDPSADQTEATQTETQLGDPIDAYAATFDNAECKPLMTIVLIDDEGAFGAEAWNDCP